MAHFPYSAALCRKDEVYKICPGCPATCQHGEPYVCFLPCVAKCVCRPGLLRDEETRRCVKPEECPGKTANLTAVAETDVPGGNETATVIEGYLGVNESTTTTLPSSTTGRQKAKI